VSTRRLILLPLTTIGAITAVLLALHAATGATVAADGSLAAPFGPLAAAVLAVTGAGVVGLVRMFSSVRRASTCGRGGC